MGIRESLLNTITSVGSSDFVRIVTSAGVSSKATVQNLFKAFETGLGAKSSLTTSDYIRVVGSDDVAYKQSVSDVLAKIGKPNFWGLSLDGYTTIPSSADLNSYNTPGSFYCTNAATAATISNSPVTDGGFSLHVESVSGAEGQNTVQTLTRAYNYNKEVWTRGYIAGSTTWGTWQKMPTRAEVDALNSKTCTELTVYDGRVANARVTDADKSRVVINGNVAVVYFDVTYVKSVTSSQTSIFTLPTNIKPKYNTYSSCIDITSGKSFILQVSSSGNVNVLNNGQININDQVTGQATFIIN